MDAQASAEVEWLRLASSDSVKVPSSFDRLQVVEAKLVARRNAEQAVWPMVRAYDTLVDIVPIEAARCSQ